MKTKHQKTSAPTSRFMLRLTQTARSFRAFQLIQSVLYWLVTLPTQISAVWRGDSIITIDNEYGRFFARPFTKTVGQTNPAHQIRLQEWIQNSPEGVCIDIGADAGVFTNSALNHGTSSRVYAFEPNPSSYPLLLKHISANDLNAEPVHAAVSKSSGTLEMPPNTVHTKSSSTCGGSGVQVPTVSLDQFAEENELAPEDIGVIKIKSLGHELSALEGMQKTLHELSAGTRLIVRIDTVGEAKEKTIAFIKWCGFQARQQFGDYYLFTKSRD
jgi:FkbM family methyltransferase